MYLTSDTNFTRTVIDRINSFCNIIVLLASLLTTGNVQAQRYELMWSDEFNGSEIDTDTWTHWFGTAFNNEDQFYTARSRQCATGTV